MNDIAEANFLGADTTAGNYTVYVHKVGRTTGWTWGPMIHVCKTIYYSVGGNRALLCQYDVAAEVDFGDSGGPAFWWNCCGANESWLGGIVVAGIEGYFFTLSSITGIRNDIANLVTY